MTQNRDRKQEDPGPDGRHRRAVYRGSPPRREDAGPPPAADSAGEHLAWSGPDWYAFPPEPPQGAGLGLGNGRNQRYYWEARRRWAPWQVRQHAQMAAELTGRRARHLADWYPEGWAPYSGRTRALALELLYVITLHDWPDLVPDPATLAELAAAGDPAPVDAAFAEFDRHARLLTDDGLHPPTGELARQAKAILQQQAASTIWRERENAARVLAEIAWATTPYDHDADGYPLMTGISVPGALATLDAMLCSSQGGFPPATVVSYRDQGARVLAEVQRCVWAPAGGPPARYALVWSRPAPGGGLGTCQEEIVPAWEVELPPGTSAPWMAAPSPAAEARQAETGDDFLADRRADLDPGEGGAGMTDADYYDRISEAGRVKTEGLHDDRPERDRQGLAGQLIRGYREHVAAEAAAVPGRVRGEDVEDQADALADDAARLAELLAAFGREAGAGPQGNGHGR